MPQKKPEIWCLCVEADRADTKNFIPFLEKLCQKHPAKRVVVDSGYESEENHHYVDGDKQLSLSSGKPGSSNVMVEWHLVSMAYNLLKLHHKVQTGRLGKRLVS